eukprot:5357083-Pleurochrysis_carterae.AAC.1
MRKKGWRVEKITCGEGQGGKQCDALGSIVDSSKEDFFSTRTSPTRRDRVHDRDAEGHGWPVLRP